VERGHRPSAAMRRVFPALGEDFHK
jgi:hypothetical protein